MLFTRIYISFSFLHNIIGSTSEFQIKIILQKVSVREVNCLKREKTPDPPGLEPGTLLVMSNALTTELWDQAEPRRR